MAVRILAAKGHDVGWRHMKGEVGQVRPKPWVDAVPDQRALHVQVGATVLALKHLGRRERWGDGSVVPGAWCCVRCAWCWCEPLLATPPKLSEGVAAQANLPRGSIK